MQKLNLSALTKAISLTFLFYIPTVALSADTYGVEATTENVTITDKNKIENVDYGAYVDKGFMASVDSQGLEISANKAVAYIKKDKWGSINLDANDGDLILSTQSNNLVDGLFIEQTSSAKDISSINATGGNIELSVSSDSATARGISVNNKAYAEHKAEITVHADNQLNLKVNGNSYAKAVSAEGTLSTVNLKANDVSIIANQLDENRSVSYYAYGLYSKGGGIVNVTADNKATITSNNQGQGDAVAIFAESSGDSSIRTTTVDLDANSIDLNATSNGRIAAGVYSMGKSGNTSVIHIGSNRTKDVVITASNENREAIAVGSFIEEEEDEQLTGGQIIVSGQKIDLAATGKIATGIYAVRGSKEGAYISIGRDDSDISINVTGTEDATGIVAMEHGKVDIQGKSLTITALSDKSATGIHVQNNGKGGAPATVNVNTENTTIIATDNGFNVYSGGVLNVNGNLYVEAKDAVVTRGNSTVNISPEQDKVVQLNGNINFNVTNDGQSGLEADSNVNIALSNPQSYLKGNVIKTQSGDDTNVDMTVNDMKMALSNGATWETDGSSFVNNLSLDNGVINILGDATQTIKVDNLSGTAVVNLAVDLSADDNKQAATMEVANAKDNSSFSVRLLDKDSATQLSSDELSPELAKNLMSNVGGSKVATTTSVPEGMVNPGFGVNSKGETTTNSANTLMQSSLEMASAAPLALNRIMMNDVRKRLGDIRTSNGTHGAWARYDGGKLSGEGGLENDFHTIQVGIDTVPTADAPRMGVAFSYTDSDAEYARGSADMKAYSLAMYSTWMGDNGQFFDLIGRMGTADTDMVVDGQHKGSMDNVALSMSGEFGWRFDVTDSIYVEPQVEATYTYVNEDSLSLSTANYDVDAVHSLLGRIGFAAGMKCPSDFGNVYVRASAVHEFLGDSKITGMNAGNTNVYEIDGKDTWFEYGIGANFNLTKSTYMWADVERTTGGALDEDWRATVGVRYAW